MAGDTAPHVVEDLLGVVQLLSDGSVVRGDESVLGPKEPLPDVPGVEWKDVVYHAAHGLRVRVYRPASSSGTGSVKLPVLVATARLPVSPVRVVGYVLLSAFFGGAERTASEADPPAGVSLPVEICEQLWHMSLPVGASRDHPVANPFGPESPSLAPVELPPALVVAPLGDVLRDRVLGYAARLKDMGKDVELAEFEGQQHGFSVLQPFGKAADELMRVLRRFVYQGDTNAER
uniref:Putative gibberellin receptor GID1L2 n=1 Tax=Aegilops tauschii TaxID=37682 RepID=M8CBX4_AEGTA